MVRILSDRVYWIFVGLVVVSSVVTAAPVPPSKPTVYSLLIIQQQPTFLADTPAKVQAGSEDFKTYRLTQAQVVKSRTVLIKALRQPNVAELSLIRSQSDPVAWLEENLKVDFPGDAAVLRLSISGDRTDQLAIIVNAVTHAYLQEAARLEGVEQAKRLAGLEKAYEAGQTHQKRP